MKVQVERLDRCLDQISVLVLVYVRRMGVIVLLKFKADGLVVNFMVAFQLTDLATCVVDASRYLFVLLFFHQVFQGQ